MKKSVKPINCISTIFVVILLLGVLLIPCINASVIKTESNDENFIKITTELIDRETITSYTSEITEQNARELIVLIDEIELKLDNAKNRQEAMEIYNNAFVSLKSYNILPPEIGIEEFQNLVSESGYNKIKSIKDLESKFFSNEKSGDNIKNLMCLVAGYTDETYVIPLIAFILLGIVIGIFSYFENIWQQFLDELNLNPFVKALLVLILSGMSLPIVFAFLATLVVFEIQPFSLINNYQIGQPSDPGSGWLHTIGLLGFQSLNGNFYGDILGFNGIKIYIPPQGGGFKIPGKYFYLGFAFGADVKTSD
jgi:hypothetical protein